MVKEHGLRDEVLMFFGISSYKSFLSISFSVQFSDSAYAQGSGHILGAGDAALCLLFKENPSWAASLTPSNYFFL